MMQINFEIRSFVGIAAGLNHAARKCQTH